MSMLSSKGAACFGGAAASTRRTVSRPAATRVSSRQATVQVKALFGGGKDGGGGGFDMKNLMESVKKAQTLVQGETQRVQAELAATEFEGFDEDETVRVCMTGNQAPKSVDITKEAMENGPEELSKRVTAAMTDAHGKSVAGMKEKMQTLAKSLGIPNADQLNM